VNLSAFLTELPERYYAWGSLAPQPLMLARYALILQHVRAMTAPAMMELLSCAVSHLDPGECYMEVGTWHGGTLIGALFGNTHATGYAIDDESMTGHDADGVSVAAQWRENVARFGLDTRAHYISGHAPACYATLAVPPVGVFLYDGAKSNAEEAYEGIAGMLPHLAESALIVLDDANTPQIRVAAWELCRRHPERCAVVLDIPTPSNAYPTFWDGVVALAWKGGAL
jgi:hypothetical protein